MGARLIRPLLVALALVAAAALLFWAVQRYVADRLAPDPVTVASASLQGLREQNRLSAFAARFVAVTTSRQSRLGLTAERTLIMPGLVRYEVDLGRLTDRDVAWNPDTRELLVTLPPIEVDGPQVDLANIREYGEGGVLTAFTDVERTLDSANRRAGQAELMRQAREPVPMRLARDATVRAVERSFALPLRAAGVDAAVRVRFQGDPEPSTDRTELTRSLKEVLADPKYR